MTKPGPIFIVGHQHSGNTMLAVLLEKTPDVRCLKGYGWFLQYYRQIERLPLEQRIRSIVKVIGDGELPPLGESERKHLLHALKNSDSGGQSEPTVALFSRAMEILAESSGKSRWALKVDTGWRRALESTLFKTEEVLSMFPGSKMVFPLRNPLDVAASGVRRGFGPATSFNGARWARTVRIAEQRQKEWPDRFIILRYEDMIARPREFLQRLFSFLDLEWSDSYLDIPHVNRAETPFNLTSEKSGLDNSKTFYYREVLSRAEEATVRAFVPGRLLRTYYSDLPAPRGTVFSGLFTKVAWLSLVGFKRWIGQISTPLRPSRTPKVWQPG